MAAFMAMVNGIARAGPAARPAHQTLLIAPHVGGAIFCPEAAADPKIIDVDDAAALCARRHSNGAGRVSALLDAVGPKLSPSGRFALGYVLTLPLMRYARPAHGGWTVDTAELENDLSLVRDIDRPVVIYLSANHFTDSGAAASAALAKDPGNLMWTRAGPLRPGGYMVVSLYAWTLLGDAPVTRLREKLFDAAVGALCRLEPKARSRIAALSLLGEVHQLFPDFSAGPGYRADPDETDYSPASVAGFRGWLARRYGTVTQMNRALGSGFHQFDEVRPPSRNVLRSGGDALAHQDPAAAGQLAIYGWAYDPRGGPPRITLSIDGRAQATTPADLNRTDVPEADHTVTTPNVGWRFDYDYRSLRPGVHTLELSARAADGVSVRFGARRFVVRGRSGAAADPRSLGIPVGSPDSHGLRLAIDGPASDQPVLFNPLAELWLEYRNAQVRAYYERFAIRAAACIPKEKLFSHQITPELNASWDPGLLAADASQKPDAHYRPGATLYGGAVFGDAFFRFKRSEGWSDYAVTEMHPIFPLSVAQMETMLERHREAGARFVAPFYIDVTPPRIKRVGGALVDWKIAPDNPVVRYGSANFYHAISDLMRNR